MKADQHLMMRALGLHNSVIRRAAWTNAGTVVEQEGDSFTLAFADAFDAVAFCLQVCAAGWGWGGGGGGVGAGVTGCGCSGGVLTVAWHSWLSVCWRPGAGVLAACLLNLATASGPCTGCAAPPLVADNASTCWGWWVQVQLAFMRVDWPIGLLSGGSVTNAVPGLDSSSNSNSRCVADRPVESC
jgi:hypothetical protein